MLLHFPRDGTRSSSVFSGFAWICWSWSGQAGWANVCRRVIKTAWQPFTPCRVPVLVIGQEELLQFIFLPPVQFPSIIPVVEMEKTGLQVALTAEWDSSTVCSCWDWSGTSLFITLIFIYWEKLTKGPQARPLMGVLFHSLYMPLALGT